MVFINNIFSFATFCDPFQDFIYFFTILYISYPIIARYSAFIKCYYVFKLCATV